MSNGPSSENPMTKHSSYPKPQADYQQIIQNPNIFLHNLRSFHVFYGTKFRVPTVGGSSLDLHRLFLEVTSRGGIEKVCYLISSEYLHPCIFLIVLMEGSEGHFSDADFTSHSTFIFACDGKKVYYFRKEEPSISAAGQTLSYAVDEGGASDKLSASSNLGDGNLVTGSIDGKFDDGYLVTVKLGSEVLKGVLYHTPLEPDVSQNLGTFDESAQLTRKKYHTAVKDLAHPKRNRSGYTFFFAEQYQRLRPSYHGQERAISKKIGQLWSNLTEAEKQVYQEKGLRDKERYKAEMLEYKSSQQVQG